jgi:hypothetical protein
MKEYLHVKWQDLAKKKSDLERKRETRKILDIGFRNIIKKEQIEREYEQMAGNPNEYVENMVFNLSICISNRENPK